MMKILDKFEIIDLGIKYKENLIIGDLQLGYEEQLRSKGTLLPKFQLKDIIARFDKIFSKVGQEGFDFEKEISDLANEAFDKLKGKSGLYYLVKSGAKGSVDLFKILTIAKGSSVDIEGNITPNITQNQNEGYDLKTFVANANEARYTQYVKSITTAKPGELARDIAYACNNVKISEKDCGTKIYLEWDITKNNFSKILGRYYLNDNNELELINEKNTTSLIGKRIKLRSPIYCKSKKGICETCYGELFKVNGTKHIGMVGSTVINDLGTNTAMKKRHQTNLSAQDTSNFLEDLKDIK